MAEILKQTYFSYILYTRVYTEGWLLAVSFLFHCFTAKHGILSCGH